jgi:hypothetical protein
VLSGAPTPGVNSADGRRDSCFSSEMLNVSQDSAEENKELVSRRWWGSRTRFSVCSKIKTKPSKRCVCVYYCSTYYKAVRVGGGG